MEIEARGIYVIGGTYDRVLHTREPKVSAVATTQEIKDKILEWGFETTDYQGPCSIHTFLLFHCKERNIPALGMWGHTPLYLQKSPRVYQAILKKLIKILEIDLDLFNLEEASRELEKQIEVIINQNPEFKNFIKELEEDYQGEKKAHETPGNIENVIRMEDFLKREKE